jgi:hypothetical protein
MKTIRAQFSRGGIAGLTLTGKFDRIPGDGPVTWEGDPAWVGLQDPAQRRLFTRMEAGSFEADMRHWAHLYTLELQIEEDGQWQQVRI